MTSLILATCTAAHAKSLDGEGEEGERGMEGERDG